MTFAPVFPARQARAAAFGAGITIDRGVGVLGFEGSDFRLMATYDRASDRVATVVA